MTAPQRWAAVATAISVLAVALPTAAQADTSPTTTTPAVPPVAICSTPAPSPGTSDGSSSAGTSSSGDSSSSGSSSTTTPPSTDQTTVEPVPCVGASGNVYIFYVITTTTTTTPINAPIIAANGPITWVSGNPVNETETGGTTTTTTSLADPFSATGAFSCTPIPGTTSMVCSLGPSRSTPIADPSGGKLRLKCTLAQSARNKSTASKGRSDSKAKTKNKAKTAVKSKPKRVNVRMTVLCSSV
jgi:hypothetical protein